MLWNLWTTISAQVEPHISLGDIKAFPALIHEWDFDTFAPLHVVAFYHLPLILVQGQWELSYQSTQAITSDVGLPVRE